MFCTKSSAKQCLRMSNVFSDILPPNMGQCLQWDMQSTNILCKYVTHGTYRSAYFTANCRMIGIPPTQLVVFFFVHLSDLLPIYTKSGYMCLVAVASFPGSLQMRGRSHQIFITCC